jgi:peptidoglycan/xylan/chitin deacetylase (PgdA/CDA1 family)
MMDKGDRKTWIITIAVAGIWLAVSACGGIGTQPTTTLAIEDPSTKTPTAALTATLTIEPSLTAVPATPTHTPNFPLATAICRQAVLPTPARHQVYAPILLYHHVGSDNFEQDGISDSRFNVTTDDFDAQMNWLSQLGYQTVRTAAITDAMYGHGTLPARPIVISFDDGWEDQYQNAFPILRAHGMTGAFFIPSTYPDGKGFVTWAQIQEMATAGMEIGSHSRTHPHLPKITEEQAWQEIRMSKVEMEKKLQVTVDAFSFPYGEMGEHGTLPTLVSRALYKAAVGVEAGSLQYEFFYLRRIEILGSMSASDFIRQLPWRGAGSVLCP